MRWVKEEELRFVKGVASGKTLDELAIIHNRTSSALELRLKKIIYDNVSKGTEVSKLAKGLNLDKNKVTQYYYSYAEFREKNGKDTTYNKQKNKSEKGTHGKTSDAKQTGGEIPQTDIINVPNIHESGKVENIMEKISILDEQNKLLEVVIKNNKMKKHVYRLYKEGQLDDETKVMLKKIFNIHTPKDLK